MKKIANKLPVVALALGISVAFAFKAPKTLLFRPVYNGLGQITSWVQVSGTYHCSNNPSKICTATFQNDDPEQQMSGSTPGNFVQP